jgi:hypothetical protein
LNITILIAGSMSLAITLLVLALVRERGRGSQRELREDQARPSGVTDRLVVLNKPGNAGGGKEPDFWRVTGRDQQSGDWLLR